MGSELTLLVDASSLLYRAFFSTPDSVRAPDGKPINAAHGFLGMLARLVADHDPSRLACCVDDDWRPAWRVALVPEYKAARVAGVATAEQSAADDEVGRQAVYVFKLLEGLGVPVVGLEACEAEDVIGTLAEREAARPGTRVAVVSGDRDLYQLVRDPDIYVLYPIKGVSELLRVDEAEITRRYGIPGRTYADYAVLRGDPSDGLPGVKGVGEKTAASLVRSYGGLDEIVAAARSAPGAGGLARVAAHLDYVERARQVVAIPRNLPIPEVDLSRPRRPPIPEVLALAEALALDGAVGRLAAALEGGGPAAR
ncbi:MAG TPA: 5'-3' exonuclease [Acidimicrobiales bacterium]|nr:5'-3' exonuclease [Acidimicrobiales bacterium]